MSGVLFFQSGYGEQVIGVMTKAGTRMWGLRPYLIMPVAAQALVLVFVFIVVRSIVNNMTQSINVVKQ